MPTSNGSQTGSSSGLALFEYIDILEKRLFDWKARGGIGWVSFVAGLIGGGLYLWNCSSGDTVQLVFYLGWATIFIIFGLTVLLLEQMSDRAEKRQNIEFVRSFMLETTRAYMQDQVNKQQALTGPNVGNFVKEVTSQLFPKEQSGHN